MARFGYAKRMGRKARKRAGVSYVAKGEKPPLGAGGRFQALKGVLKKRKGIRTPGALAAWIGRRKYGKKAFQRMAVAGRKRRNKGWGNYLR